MDQDDSCRGRGRNKCFWTEDEVHILIQVLQSMACDPSWKTNSGFKSNYMSEVLKRILDIMPNFTKKVTPHLESKIKWLKSKFHCIIDMLRESGCQWNDVEQKIACEKQWFDSYCQTHKEANGMWDFKFPYLNQLEYYWNSWSRI
ncbi:OLC1v1004828C1 [Oldenlandia corymbosa var. corymbosa]|uniref:OLC1v1004828C1 n=1 Tax=Oldenlandia corymbosa var. corymbosa TaxID=529605 RepID=A0AAV1DD94_OLDCO|nr:OLC1v1004828C1 [Oldenlandia corymbosa var. corymbosa]